MMHQDLLEALQTALGGRYRVERLLGTGGTSAVYLAHDARHDRLVAIKVLRTEVAASLGPERFLREIRIAAQLNHPHILTLHDSGEANGLLYYVMPYVQGESLRELLGRQGHLPLADAVRITREVASALGYAHARGVIHRDIKPENILLQDGFAQVADFGLARALTEARSPNTTETGLIMGTPEYMAPEQATGSANVDGRADIYALGCVLFEMLSGGPPFPGDNPMAILAKHISQPVPPLRSPERVPSNVADAVRTAMAKRPEDRFQTATRLMAALEPHEVAALRRRRFRPGWGSIATALAALAILLVAREADVPDRLRRALAGPGLDSLAFLVLPARSSDGDSELVEAVAGVKDGLTHWHEVSLADARDLPVQARLGADEDLSPGVALQMAQRLRAGRLILVDTRNDLDSAVVTGSLLTTGDQRELGRAAIAVPAGAGLRRAGAELSNQLVLGGREAVSPDLLATTSLAASRSLAEAARLRTAWDLVGADSAYQRALAADPGYAAAALGSALTRFWRRLEPSRWLQLLDLTLRPGGSLSPTDSALAATVRSVSLGQFDPACDALYARARTAAEARNFALWWTVASCLEADRTVVADAGTPSGFRFRSSPWQALLAFEHAMGLVPASRRAFSADGFEHVQRLMLTSPDELRGGVAARPGEPGFVATAAWVGDSLEFVPWHYDHVGAGLPLADARARGTALARLRDRFHVWASSWTAIAPNDPAALEALGLAMELLGDPAACDTVRRARAVATDDGQRARLGALEAWLRVKVALRDNLGEMARVAALADTVLRLAARDTAARFSREVAGLAALTGRPELAIRLDQINAEIEYRDFSPAIRGPGTRFQTYAGLGGPADSLLRYRGQVLEALERNVPEADRVEARRNFVLRPAGLLFPELVVEGVYDGDMEGSYLLTTQAAFLGSGGVAARARLLGSIRARRTRAQVQFVTPDGILPEAKLVLMVEGPGRAADWLGRWLRNLAYAPPEALADPIQAGALVRAMAFQAELAEAAGRRAAAREWAGGVAVLWARADPFLRPVAARMAELAK